MKKGVGVGVTAEGTQEELRVAGDAGTRSEQPGEAVGHLALPVGLGLPVDGVIIAAKERRRLGRPVNALVRQGERDHPEKDGPVVERAVMVRLHVARNLWHVRVVCVCRVRVCACVVSAAHDGGARAQTWRHAPVDAP